MQLEDITLIGDQHEMYPMRLEDNLLISSVASPIVVIWEYCEGINTLDLYTDLNPAHTKIWVEFENSLVNIISDSWQYIDKWVFNKEHIFDDYEKTILKTSIEAIASSLNLTDDNKKIKFVRYKLILSINIVLST